MANVLSWRKGLLSVLFWSVIAAAFIGPGTVTTAASAGASFNLELLWALAFSILATAVLQEAAARITLASGKNLGEIISLSFAAHRFRCVPVMVFSAVAFGCAAYQAGNLLGALAGIDFFSSLPKAGFTVLLAAGAALLLWQGNFRVISHFLALIVACMGIAFIYVAFQAEHVRSGEVLAGLVPGLPEGAGLIVLGLVGTTIVPYNLFLASGISRDQSISEMRVGVWLAVLVGGLISMAILVVGSSIGGAFDFDKLATALAAETGNWAIAFFGFGLFAAGFTSSITAPLAAAITGRSLLGKGEAAWGMKGRNFRLTWGGVLGIGALFGILDLQPIPVIILAQAINGLLLPLVAVFLIFAVNNRDLIAEPYRNSLISNALMLIIVGVACYLGLLNIWRAMVRVWPSLTEFDYAMSLISVLVVLVMAWIGAKLFLSARNG